MQIRWQILRTYKYLCTVGNTQRFWTSHQCSMCVVTNSDFKIKITKESIYVRQGSDTRHMRALLSFTDEKSLSWVLKWERRERHRDPWRSRNGVPTPPRQRTVANTVQPVPDVVITVWMCCWWWMRVSSETCRAICRKYNKTVYRV